jgi:hypothetical protein
MRDDRGSDRGGMSALKLTKMTLNEFILSAEQRLEDFHRAENEKLKSDLRRAGLTEAEIAAAIEVGDEMWRDDLPRLLMETLKFVDECRELEHAGTGKLN